MQGAAVAVADPYLLQQRHLLPEGANGFLQPLGNRIIGPGLEHLVVFAVQIAHSGLDLSGVEAAALACHPVLQAVS